MATAIIPDASSDGEVTSDGIAIQGPSATLGTSSLHLGSQVFMAFDTSGIPDDATIQSVELSLHGTTTALGSFTIEARLFNWGPTVDATDWRSGAQLAALPLMAQAPSSAVGDLRFALTSETVFVDNVNKTGLTYIALSTNYQRLEQLVQARCTVHTNRFDTAEEHLPLLTVTYSTEAVYFDGAVDLAGSGAIGADGALVLEGASALAGSSSVAATGNVLIVGAAALVGASSLSAAADVVVQAGAALRGTGVLAVEFLNPRRAGNRPLSYVRIT